MSNELIVRNGLIVTGESSISGSLTVTGSIYSNKEAFLTASYAITASHVLGQSATASYALYSENAGYAATASHVTGLSSTASYLLGNAESSYIQFSGITGSQVEAKLQWDSENKTLQFGLGGGNVNLAIGQRFVTLTFNTEATTLNPGEVVYLNGDYFLSENGKALPIGRASDVGDNTSRAVLGVVSEAIPSSGFGFVTVKGRVENIDTSRFALNTQLWVSSTPGVFDNIRPTAPSHSVFVGTVTNSDPIYGSLYVDIIDGAGLYELHDVRINSVQDGDLLSYSSADSVWKNTKNLNVNSITASAIQVIDLHVVTVSSSIDYVSGSTKFGSSLSDTHQFTGSVSINGNLSVGPNFSIQGTSSYALTASYIDGGYY